MKLAARKPRTGHAPCCTEDEDNKASFATSLKSYTSSHLLALVHRRSWALFDVVMHIRVGKLFEAGLGEPRPPVARGEWPIVAAGAVVCDIPCVFRVGRQALGGGQHIAHEVMGIVPCRAGAERLRGAKATPIAPKTLKRCVIAAVSCW